MQRAVAKCGNSGGDVQIDDSSKYCGQAAFLTLVACSVQSPNMATMAAMYALCSEGTMTRRRVFQIAPSAAGQPAGVLGRQPPFKSFRCHSFWVHHGDLYHWGCSMRSGCCSCCNYMALSSQELLWQDDACQSSSTGVTVNPSHLGSCHCP